MDFITVMHLDLIGRPGKASAAWGPCASDMHRLAWAGWTPPPGKNLAPGGGSSPRGTPQPILGRAGLRSAGGGAACWPRPVWLGPRSCGQSESQAGAPRARSENGKTCLSQAGVANAWPAG